MNQFEVLFKRHIKKSKINGNQLTGLCPFHDDRNPSFSANLETGQWNCFACDDKQGNAKQFAELVEDNTFITRNTEVANSIKTKSKKYKKPNWIKGQDISDKVVHFFKDRGISRQTIIINDVQGKKVYMPQYDKKVLSIAFPYYDRQSDVLNVKYRSLQDKNFMQTKGGRKVFYGLKTFPQGDTTAIIVEGEIDSLTLDEIDYTFNLSVPNGANGLKFLNNHSKLLDQLETIIIAVDNDKAGQELKKKLINRFSNKNLWEVDYPDNCKDVNDVLVNLGANRLEQVIQESKPIDNIQAQIKSITKYNLTDAGAGEFFADLNKGNLVYNHTLAKWLFWNGEYWQVDKSNKIKQYVKKSAEDFRKKALNIDRDKSQEYMKFGFKLESEHKSNNMLKFAKSEPGVAKEEKDFDSHKHLVQFDNGVYDLRNMEFRSGTPNSYITKSVGYNYHPKAKSKRFEAFLHEIFNGNSNLINYIKKYIGYTLSGEVTDQSFLLLHGNGSNGKSVFLNTIRHLLGEYAVNTPFSTFETQYGNATNDLANLSGSRLVTSSELSGQKDKINEERLKVISGGDTITARFLYQEYFEYNPQFKLFLAMNRLPNVKDQSLGFWRRVRIIPFNVIFKGDNRDRFLESKLKKEVQGIANIAIEGYKQYKKEGLKPPNIVIGAVNQYRGDNDLLQRFINSECIFGDYDIKANSFYEHLIKWIKSNFDDIEPITKTKLGRDLNNFPNIKKTKKRGERYYSGLKIRRENNDSNF